jgi:hypothetical protein
VTKLNKNKKKLHYETKINDITINEILDKKANSAPSFIESDRSFITTPTDIVNYFNDFLIGIISKLRHDMPPTNADTAHPSISDQIMKDKHCNLEFCKVGVKEVKK